MFGFVLFYRFFYTLKREKLNCIQSKRSFDFNNEIDFRDSRNFCSLNWNQTEATAAWCSRPFPYHKDPISDNVKESMKLCLIM